MIGSLPHSQPCSVGSPAFWNHTHCAPSRRSDLGVSGLGNPGPNPRPSPSLRQGRPGSRGRSSSSPGPRQRTGKPGRKGMGRGRTAITDAPPHPRGNPFQPGGSAPFLLSLPPRGQRWGRELPGAPGAGEGVDRGRRLLPSGRKVGRRQAEGAPARPVLPGAGALAHLLVPRPWPRDGRLRLGADSARSGARGTGRRLSGPGGAIRASYGRRRRLGSAAPLGLRGSAGGAGSGWGRGRGRAPPGLGLGLGAPGWLRPRATRPGLRTWRSARSEGEALGTRWGAHPHTDPGAPRHRQPPTRAQTDTRRRGHTLGYTLTDPGTLRHR